VLHAFVKIEYIGSVVHLIDGWMDGWMCVVAVHIVSSRSHSFFLLYNIVALFYTHTHTHTLGGGLLATVGHSGCGGRGHGR
jgi:hypothetical protein